MVFDNRLFFDDEFIKFLKYKNSIVSTKTNYPLDYTFFKRIQPKLVQETRTKLFSIDIKSDKTAHSSLFATSYLWSPDVGRLQRTLPCGCSLPTSFHDNIDCAAKKKRRFPF